MKHFYLMEKLLHIVGELIHNGIECTFFHEDNRVFVRLIGFYKSGEVVLFCKIDNTVVCKARYDEHLEIHSLEDIVKFHHLWWERSYWKWSEWRVPEEKWMKLYEKFGLDRTLFSNPLSI